MGKTKNSRAQEALLMVFVAVCCVLVAMTLVIAFDESNSGATTTAGANGYPVYSNGQTTVTPSAHPVTPPPTIDPRTEQPTLTF